jgi:endonuclease YncB( thermonuclease family)
LNCPCKVVEIIDGDTVLILDQFRSSRKIWLAGIDAPELGQLYGERSKKHLGDLVMNQSIEVEYIQRERYGRIVGKLIKDGKDINLHQISNGYAWYFKQNENELSKLDSAIYRSAESAAKSKHQGLWSVAAIPPWEYRNSQ